MHETVARAQEADQQRSGDQQKKMDEVAQAFFHRSASRTQAVEAARSKQQSEQCDEQEIDNVDAGNQAEVERLQMRRQR